MKSNTPNETFERALFTTLKNNGLLFPVTDHQVEEFEKQVGDTKVDLPADLNDSSKFIPKRGKTIQFVPNNRRLKQQRQYAKVAFKKGRKKRRKK